MENLKRAEKIIEEITKQREERPKVSLYIHPYPVSPGVCEILSREGYTVQLKKDDITRQFITKITW